jgi:hypothetical protein
MHVALHGIHDGPGPVGRDMDADERLLQRMETFHESHLVTREDDQGALRGSGHRFPKVIRFAEDDLH